MIQALKNTLYPFEIRPIIGAALITFLMPFACSGSYIGLMNVDKTFKGDKERDLCYAAADGDIEKIDRLIDAGADVSRNQASFIAGIQNSRNGRALTHSVP